MPLELPLLAFHLPTLVVLTARFAGFFITVPFYSTSASPALIRGGLALALGSVIYPIYAPTVEIAATSTLVMFVAKELLTGLFLGGLVSLLFAGLQLAGQLAGFGIGLSMAKIIDPGSESQSSLGPALYQYVGLILFIGIGGHRHILSAVVRSYELLPVGAMTVTEDAVRQVLLSTRQMFQVGLRLAAPVASILFLVDVLLALGNRIVPQIPMLMLGMPLKSWVGFAILGLGLRAFVKPAMEWLAQAPELLLGVSRMMAVTP